MQGSPLLGPDDRPEVGVSDALARVLRERGFDALHHNDTDGVVTYSVDGVVVDCNEATLRLTGRKRDEIVGSHFSFELDSPSRAERLAHFAEAATGTPARFVARNQWGAVRPSLLEVTLLPLTADGGGVAGVIGLIRDVTEMAELLDALNSNEALNRIAGRIAKFAGWRYDVASGSARWSEGTADLLGVDPDDLDDLERTLETLAGPRDRQLLVRAFTRCIQRGEAFDVELSLVDDQGRALDVRMTGEPVCDDDGEVVLVQGALLDVSEERRRVHHREAMERRVVETLDEIAMATFIVARDWTVTFASQAGLDTLGLEVDPVGRDTIWHLLPEAAVGRLRPLCEAAMYRGESGRVIENLEYFGRWFEETVLPTADGIVITLRDVSLEHDAEHQLTDFVRRAAFLSGLLDLSKDAMIVRHFVEGITYWNRAAEEIYGWTYDEVRGRSTVDVLFSDPADSREAFEAVYREGFWHGELHHRTRDGRPLVVDSRLQLIRDEAGEPVALFGVNSDVTKVAHEREERIRAQRMESIGTLAGGIAHDLNNVLTPILVSIELLLRDESDEDRRRTLHTMAASVARGAEMISQVRTVASGGEGERRQLSLSVLLFEFLQFCRDTMPSSIEVVADVSDDLPSVVGDSTQLLQVLVNLATNARDAMPSGGRFSVRAARSNLWPERGDGTSEMSAASIEVSDTGTGMDPEVLARAFEPFFTTKPFGEGTGLGLATSLSIVETHGGRLEVDSLPGQGTTFRIVLPAGRHDYDARVPVGTGIDLDGHGRRILVVDDEASILMALDETLRARGFVVDVAQDGKAAMATLETARDPYDLLITDLNMPRIGGLELVEMLGARGLDTPVVYMSGVGDAPGAGARAAFVTKPFTTRELIEVLARVLGDA